MLAPFTRANRRGFLRTIGAIGGAAVGVSGSARAQPTRIDDCETIDSSGRYVLTEDVEHDGGGPCIEIAAEDVVFDGGGHTIRGAHQAAGIHVTGENVTVQNATLEGWVYGVHVDGGSSALVRGLSTSGEIGVLLESADENILVNNDCADDFYDVRVVGSDDNRIRRNRFRQERGVHLEGSTGNAVVRNRIEGVESGISVVESTGTLIARNRVLESLTGGIVLYRSEGTTVGRNRILESEPSVGDGVVLREADRNTLVRNVSADNHGTGVLLERSDRNRLLQNRVVRNGGGGIVLADADGNQLLRNVTCDNDGEQLAVGQDSTGNRLIRNTTDCS